MRKNNYFTNKLKLYCCAFLLGACLSSFANTEENPALKCEEILIGAMSPLPYRLLLRILQTDSIPWTSVPILIEKWPTLQKLSLDEAKRIYAQYYRDTYSKEFDFEAQPRILTDPLHRLLLRLIEAEIQWSAIRNMVELKAYSFGKISIEEAKALYAELYQRAYGTEYDFEAETRNNSHQRSFFNTKTSHTSSQESFYDVLSVSPNATQAEIKQAFRKAAQKWHPDRNLNNDTAEEMKKINEAYNVLGDPDIRLEYDRFYFQH
ncbi:MAG: DnaJ domain-containing protein [Bdellovibrionales bacterium]|nr:DnaJ domain-containing protein [Bdellovibrionales bacterium]